LILKKENREFIIELVKLLKPKHYDKMTWLLLSVGLILISRPIPSQLINEYLKRKYQFEIFGTFDILIGFFLIISALIYHTIIKSKELQTYRQIQTVGIGGEGGSGKIKGNRGTIIGGKGGKGGVSGIGGKGGGGIIEGDGGTIIGGDGGDAAQADGRGGRGARGPTEKFGRLTMMWGYGNGGSSPNHPEYDRRLNLLRQFRTEYMNKFPFRVLFIDAGIDQVPIDWINQRLVECNENWSVELGNEGYLLPPLDK